ncbi:hypothetical protein [Flavobacterium hydatis]|uniref:Peptidase S74 domain-containing protein n=1 Tax=Flavobacterium hydatis TaxID=991 RepID=A0ABX4CH09_FLAHY|nr:hypothetical protein [Flavobacterium hydatis]OXA93651.1 hypothetical protein B0A62_12940 [Flavobacterium hydatis]
MKKITLSAIIIMTSIVSLQAQIYGTIQGNSTNNNFIGIGTNNPIEKLNINGGTGDGASFDAKMALTKVSSTGNVQSAKIVLSDVDTNFGNLTFKVKTTASKAEFESFYTDALTIKGSNANVGIGTTNPITKLDVVGTIKSFESTPLSSTTNSFQLINEIGGSTGSNNKMMNKKWLIRDATSDNWWTARLHDGLSVDASFMTPRTDTRTWWERDPNDDIQSWGNEGKTYLTINKSNIGIGTTNPDEKLTVNGKIHAKEVRIDLDFPAPDYVFVNDYKLKSLQEVEEFIKQNSHLPEIPSAKEIKKNGLMLAEMNMSLLKKIEELTLYSIAQEKNIKSQNNKIIELEKQNEKLSAIEKRLEKIEMNTK